MVDPVPTSDDYDPGDMSVAAAFADDEAANRRPRQMPAQLQPCRLVRVHVPRVVITEKHHTKPVYLQKRLWGREVYAADLWLCSNCHEAVHAWLYWLLEERAKPIGVGRAARAEAERTYSWWLLELGKAGRGAEL